MKFNFDSKTISCQIPSGILLGLLSMLISQYIHLPLIPTKIHYLVFVILILDFLHLIGKLQFDISNLFRREPTFRNLGNEKLPKIFQIYVEEHIVFLVVFYLSIFLTRILLHSFHK